MWAQEGFMWLLILNTTKVNLSAGFSARRERCFCHQCLALNRFVLMMVICLQPQELRYRRLRPHEYGGCSQFWSLQEASLCLVFWFCFFPFSVQSLRPWQAAVAVRTDYVALSLWLLVQMFGAAAQQALKCCMQSDQARKQLAENYYWPGLVSWCVVPTASHLVTQARLWQLNWCFRWGFL